MEDRNNGGAPAVEEKSSEGAPAVEVMKDGGAGKQEEGGQVAAGTGALPRCFSSPQADPSDGAWRATRNGVHDSPAYSNGWELPSAQFSFLKK